MSGGGKFTSANGTRSAAIVGLGYVGLPLAHAVTTCGTGIDTSPTVRSSLIAGTSLVEGMTFDELEEMKSAGFTVTDQYASATHADTIVLCLPTPLSDTGGPDLTSVIQAATALTPHLRRGQIIILESTTYPGTTEEVLIPILEQSGMKAGVDFSCAYSPERIDPGNPTYGVENTPKIVAGLTENCTNRAVAFYGQFVDEIVVATGIKEAEMAKLIENTYRHVNIALMNELVKFSHDLEIDLWNAIDCASSKPFGFQAFRPGPGVGGHCIPIDPQYLAHRIKTTLGQPFRLIELASEVNNSMPAYIVQRLQDLLNSSSIALRASRVLVLGVTYKADISDLRHSPSLDVIRLLRMQGTEVTFHDPYASQITVNGETLFRVSDIADHINEIDAVLLLQAHSVYSTLPDFPESLIVLDTRGFLKTANVTYL